MVEEIMKRGGGKKGGSSPRRAGVAFYESDSEKEGGDRTNLYLKEKESAKNEKKNGTLGTRRISPIKFLQDKELWVSEKRKLQGGQEIKDFGEDEGSGRERDCRSIRHGVDLPKEEKHIGRKICMGKRWEAKLITFVGPKGISTEVSIRARKILSTLKEKVGKKCDNNEKGM